MNLSLSDEQILLRESARGTLSRHKTIEAAREALEDPAKLPDLWPTAVEAGWPGLLISEDHGGAGLDAFDAMLIAEECGRVLAAVPLLGVLPATAILDAAGHGSLAEVAAGGQRPVYLAARPPGDLETRWTVEPAAGMTRAAAPQIEGQGEGEGVTVTGSVAFVPDAPGADLLVVVGTGMDGEPAAAVVQAGAPGVQIEAVTRYDATRSLANVTLLGAAGELLAVDADVLADAWYLAHALIAAESLGAVQTCLERSVQYAKERFTFGRAIGSYQSIKHELVEILRRQENSRGLQYYAGWAWGDGSQRPNDEFPLAASAARSAAGEALDFAARAMINVHGGIGATWEHDAPLFFRRAELSRRLLGGTRDATDRVAERTLAGATV
jgi:alkylation response protein AidB-like acyl-CoA dehydrogenase